MGHKFDHVGLTVTDIARSAAFYARFGFTPSDPEPTDCVEPWIKTLTGFPDAEVRIAFQELDGVLLELLQYVAPEGGKKTSLLAKDAGSAHVAIGVDDVHEEYARLVAEGVEFCSEPVVIPDGIWKGMKIVYAIDPDGNIIELSQGSVEA